MKELNKNNPFKTPEDYFDNLTDKVMDSINSESSKLPSTDGFSTPEGYFTGLSDQLNERLKNEPKVVQLPSYRKYYWAAASIAAMLLVFFGINQISSEEPNWNDLATADIESYLLSNTDDISVYDLSEELELIVDADDFTEFIESDEIEAFLENELENLNIEDYEIN